MKHSLLQVSTTKSCTKLDYTVPLHGGLEGLRPSCLPVHGLALGVNDRHLAEGTLRGVQDEGTWVQDLQLYLHKTVG